MLDRNLNRRRFLQGTAAGLGAAAVGGSVAHAAETEKKPIPEPEVDPKKLIWRNKRPGMEYIRMGRTNFMVSRMVAGWLKEPSLWRRVAGMGVNYFDTARGYGQYEVELKDFLAKARDSLWVTSKSTGIAGYDRIDPEVRKLYLKAMKAYLDESDYAALLGAYDSKDGKDRQELLRFHEAAVKKEKKTGKKPDLRPVGKLIAEMYARMLDESLERMDIDNVDCYMVHGVEIPWIFDCTELWDAYAKAHKAGKVKHFGFSTHKHQKETLAAAVEANKRGPWKIDLIMPGVNPESFDNLKPELEGLKRQDVGLIAMKTQGMVPRTSEDRSAKFKKLMGDVEYDKYQRAKLWILNLSEGLIDGVIAGVKDNEEMEKAFTLPMVKMSAAATRELRSLVKLEMAGSCTLCGHCETHCPKHIAVTDMIRYHAYIHQYDDRELARELYELAGYDPAKLCDSCGACADVCPTGVPITSVLERLSADMA